MPQENYWRLSLSAITSRLPSFITYDYCLKHIESIKEDVEERGIKSIEIAYLAYRKDPDFKECIRASLFLQSELVDGKKFVLVFGDYICFGGQPNKGAIIHPINGKNRTILKNTLKKHGLEGEVLFFDGEDFR